MHYRKFMLILSFCTLSTFTFAQDQSQLSVSAEQSYPLRISESVKDIISDLENIIPAYLHDNHIPGTALALLHDNHIVWQKGFGVSNVITGKPVTTKTIFEMASFSKVVTAYIALRLVDKKLLSFDEPLNNYLSEPWLPPSPYRDVITLRHVLSHSSGLAHNKLGRKSLFAPELGYSYSAIGYLYLQAVIEQVTGQSLEDVAQELVFNPLGMKSSSFVNNSETTHQTANGYVRALVPVLLFLLPYAVFLVLIGFVGILIGRLFTGHWRPNKSLWIGILALTFIAVLLPTFILLSKISLTEFAWLTAICGCVLTMILFLMFIAGRVLFSRLSIKYRWQKGLLNFVYGTLAVVGVILLAGKIRNVPVPKWPTVHPGAASTLRATVGDVALFLKEMARPHNLSADMATQLKSPQVKLCDDMSWGLGPGIMHSQHGDALWQWGQHVDFQSIIVIYPDYGFGVVVVTNSDLFNPDVAIELARKALGGKFEPIRQASHLAFNFKKSN